MTDILKEVEQFEEEYNTRREELVSSVKKKFPSLFKELFDKYQNLDGFAWPQYTDYFNDGAACTFSVHHYEDSTFCLINDSESPDDFLTVDEQGDLYDVYYPMYREIRKVLQQLPTDFYEDMFGDHALVRLFRDGKIVVEEYDHD